MGLVVGVGVVTSAQALAGSSPERRDWHACFTWAENQATGCPTASAIQSAVERLVERPSSEGNRCDLRVYGTAQRTRKHGTVVELEFRTDQGADLGQRRLEGNDPKCSTYEGPIALVIALMLESTELGATVTDPTRNSPAASSELLTSQPSPKSVSPAPSPKPRLETHSAAAVSADARGAWGLLPGAAFGTGLALDVMPNGWVPLRFDSSIWFPSQSEPSRPGGRFWAWQAGLGCVPFAHDGHVRTQLVAGVNFGFIYGMGTGLDVVRQARRPYGDLALRLVNSTALIGPIELVAQVGLAVPWIRPKFVYSDETDSSVRAHRPESVIGQVGLGLSWRLDDDGEKRKESP